ncbi:MAG: ABC-2 transporter permease [Syntrophomonadaceae bacterium]|jgi:hypothetical protein
MQNSKWKMLGQLYRKDMYSLRKELVAIIIFTLLLDGWIFFASDYPNQAIIVPASLTMGLAFFLPLITSFKMLSQEWSQNTVYLIMSLPVSGALVIGSKLLAVMSQFLIGTLVAGITGSVMLWFTFPEIHPFIIENFSRLLFVYLFCISGILYLCSGSFLSQVIGHLSRRYSGFITVGVFIAILYLVGKLTDLLNIMDSASQLPGGITAAVAGGFYLLISLLLMVAAVYLYNYKIEL